MQDQNVLPKTSIIIAIHKNFEAFNRTCLTPSRQTKERFEVVITEAIGNPILIESIANRAPRSLNFRHLSRKDKLSSKTRITYQALSQAPYLSCLDGDHLSLSHTGRNTPVTYRIQLLLHSTLRPSRKRQVAILKGTH